MCLLVAVFIALFNRGGANLIMTVAGGAAGGWVIAASMVDPVRTYLFRQQARMTRAQWGMVVSHLGVGMTVLGVTFTATKSIEFDASARPGDSVTVGAYDFRFESIRPVTGPNYEALEGRFIVTREGREIAVLSPQKRTYKVQRNPMTEAAIDAGFRRDLFVALGEPLGDEAWSVRVQYKPLIRWIWLGAFVMAFGGFIASTDRRYRQSVPQSEPSKGATAPAMATAVN